MWMRRETGSIAAYLSQQGTSAVVFAGPSLKLKPAPAPCRAIDARGGFAPGATSTPMRLHSPVAE